MTAHGPHHDADVLIAGLGPVGGVLAGLLALRGLRVIAVEREQEAYRLPRAAHFDHEIMRVFQELGIAEAVAADARVVNAYEFHNATGEILVRYDLAGLRTVSGWPPSYLFHQPTMEQALRERLVGMADVDMRTGWQLADIIYNDDAGVTALVSDAAGVRQKITARFVVGADGAASAVRQALGIGLEDFGFEKSWLVIDTIVRDEGRLPQNAIQICDPTRPITVMPMSPNRRRWEFMLRDGETAAAMLDDVRLTDLLRSQIDGMIDPADITIVRKAVYVFHGLVATSWRARSVLLAGDAAHQMPPFMGQGMCSGIRDAANLAWKLAMVCRGEAAPALLDSYEAERAPHVRAIIGASIGMGQLVCMNDPEAVRERDAGMLALRARDGDGRGTPPLPPLSGGCLSATERAGTLFRQSEARLAEGVAGRLDDLLGNGFWLVTSRTASIRTPDFVTLARIGVELRDADDIAGWLEAADAEAALVRPDHVVFGTGRAEELLAMLAAHLRVADLRSEHALAESYNS
jgi:3-(3-hydroxy-phenyl)propionate hydroxylase